MRTIYILLLLFLWASVSVFSQEVLYRAGLHNFFDNNEFDGCPEGDSQTMAGVHFVPQIGLRWDSIHHIFVGVDAMHEYGSDKAIGYYDPIAYYEFDNSPFHFYMGALPRKLVLDKYPLFFFQDSILNYRPVMTGLFWEYYSKKGSYANVWLDWTSRQTFTKHEAFFMGWSGRYNWKNIYGQHLGYMYHFASVMDPDNHTPVHDNGRMWTALGANFSANTPLDEFDINAGWAVGLERDRGSDDGWYCPQGLLSQIKAEYRGLGLVNTYYRGETQGKFYDTFGSQLYWNDRLYRAARYNRLDGYIYFMKTDVVSLKFIFSLHFVKAGMFTEQQFYATFDLDNLKKKKPGKKYQYLWDNWFTGDGK
jgi:hypothetical protein